MFAAALVFPIDAAAYFVRPVVTFGPGNLIDGLVRDGTTQNQVGYTDAARTARSDVNLATGEMKLFASGSGASASASGQGIMGDALTFLGGAGTSADFSFGLEALLNVDVFGNTLDSPLFSWSVAVGVFEQGVADYTNWFALGPAEALLFDTQAMSISNPTEDIFNEVAQIALNGSVPLASNRETLDIFYQASIFGGSGSLGQITSFTFDGENTATAGLVVENGVTVHSQSGVFLGFGSEPGEVPAPLSIALFGAGLLALRLSRIRRGAVRNAGVKSNDGVYHRICR